MKRSGPAAYLILGFAICLWVGWVSLVYFSDADWLHRNDQGKGRFEDFGQFGDAFGAFSSLMTALAAGAALSAFLTQRKEIRIQEFERNFFILLQNLQTHIQQTDVSQADPKERSKLAMQFEGMPHSHLHFRTRVPFLPDSNTIAGRDALKALVNILRVQIGDAKRFLDSKQIHRTYAEFYNQWNDDLGHYFRTLYHLFKMIDDECPKNPMRYARIARSHLSSSEIILVSYNCSVGEGRFKFKKLVEKYSIIHNFHVDQSDQFYEREFEFFKRMFSPDAFGNSQIQIFEYT